MHSQSSRKGGFLELLFKGVGIEGFMLIFGAATGIKNKLHLVCLYTCHCGMVTVTCPRTLFSSGFDILCVTFDTSSVVLLALVSLHLTCPTILCRDFFLNAHYLASLTKQLQGGLKSIPANRIREAFSHLRYSFDSSLLLSHFVLVESL